MRIAAEGKSDGDLFVVARCGGELAGRADGALVRDETVEIPRVTSEARRLDLDGARAFGIRRGLIREQDLAELALGGKLGDECGLRR